MSQLAEVENLRDLEREKIEQTTQKIENAMEMDNYRLVLKYKENLLKLLEKWEGYHLQVAEKKKLGINDSSMRSIHREVLDLTEKTVEKADNYYIQLKVKKKEEKQAERQRIAAKAESEKAARQDAEREIRMPILKDLFTSEMREINRITTGYVKNISNRSWVPDIQALKDEIAYIESRYGDAMDAYQQYMTFGKDQVLLGQMRELKNAEERKYRADILAIKSYMTKLETNPRPGNVRLPARQAQPPKNQNQPAKIVKQQSPDKTPFEKTVLKSFEDNITSVSMDDRHVLVGLSNGKVGAVYYKEKFVKEKFVTDCSSVGITAVLADSFDVAGKSLFYAGDQRGWLYALGEKGELIHKLKVKDGPIFAIQDVEVKKIWVYSNKGRSVVVLERNQLVVQANKASKFSMDLDATFHRTRAKGDFPLEEYDAKIPSRVYGSPRLMLEGVGDDIQYINVFAYATDSQQYNLLVEDDKAPTTLNIVGKGHSRLRSIDMGFPVKQVVNTYTKIKDTRKDALYVLTCDDRITRFKVTELIDESIDNDDLTQVVIFKDDDANAEAEDIGDIESFTVRNGQVLFVMRDADDLFEIHDDI